MSTTDLAGPAGGADSGEPEASLREERALYKDLVEAQPRGIYRFRVLSSPPAEPET